MKENAVLDTAKKAGTFVGKAIVCFAAGLMLVADTAVKRNYVTGNINVNINNGNNLTGDTPVAPADEATEEIATAGKKNRFACRMCGAPVDVKSFRPAHGYVLGKGFYCEDCYRKKFVGSKKFYDDETDEAVATCADCGKEVRAESFGKLKKYRIGKNYYCRECFLNHDED